MMEFLNMNFVLTAVHTQPEHQLLSSPFIKL